MKSPLTWFTLHFPRPVPEDEVMMFFRALAADRRHSLTVLEIVAAGGTISVRVGVPENVAADFRSLVTSVLRTATTERISKDFVRAPLKAWSVEVVGKTTPLRLDAAEAVARHLAAVLETMRKDEVVIVQFMLGERRAPRVIEEKALRPREHAGHVLHDVVLGQPVLGANRRRSWQNKVSEPGFSVAVRVGVAAVAPRIDILAGGVVAAMRNAEAPGIRFVARRMSPRCVAEATPGRRFRTTLSCSELAALAGLPVGRAPYTAFGHERSASLRYHGGRAGRVVGRSTYPGERDVLVRQSIEDALTHSWLLGPTGCGKSSLAMQLALADAEAGRGLVFIDPKGDVLPELLARLPNDRLDDVVLMDASDRTAVVGYNPLALGERAGEVVADHVLSAFRNMSHGSWGPRLDLCLSTSLLTLVNTPGMNLTALPLLLTNERFRRSVVATVTDPVLLDYWTWFEGLSKPERDQVIAPVLSRARSLLLRPRMRAVLGQTTPKFDLADVFRKRRILLISLSEGLLGPEAANLLGRLLVSGLWQRAMERVGDDAHHRTPVVFYIDEWQRLIDRDEDFADMLARGRSLGVGLCLANQNLSQIVPPTLRSVAMANCRSKVFFQLAHEDAKVAAAGHPELAPEDFERLERFHCYAAIADGGAVKPFASTVTLPLPEPTNDVERLREAVRRRYARPVEEVEDDLRRLLEGTLDEVGQRIGRRKRT